VPWSAISSAFGADTEKKAPLGYLVDAGDGLGGLDRVALRHQADAGADLEPRGDGGSRTQHDEWVHDVVVSLRQVAALRPGRGARQGDVAVLGQPERLEAAILQRPRQLGRRNRVVRDEHGDADVHDSAPPLDGRGGE